MTSGTEHIADFQFHYRATEEIQELICISHSWIRAVPNTDKCKCYLLNFEVLNHFSSVFLSFHPFVGVTSLKRLTCIWAIQWHSRRKFCVNQLRFFIGSTPDSAITLTQISGVASYGALGHMQHPQQCHYTYTNQWRRQLWSTGAYAPLHNQQFYFSSPKSDCQLSKYE